MYFDTKKTGYYFTAQQTETVVNISNSSLAIAAALKKAIVKKDVKSKVATKKWL